MLRRAIAAVGISVSLSNVGPGCRAPRDAGPALQILGESGALRSDESVPATSPWFDGATVKLLAARGETLGLQVVHRGGGAVTWTLPGVTVRGFDVARVRVTRPSTDFYGGSRGAGDYPDELVETATPSSDPAFFELTVPVDAVAGVVRGELRLTDRAVPVELTISSAAMPPLAVEGVWAYEDPRQLGSTLDAPTDAERACIAEFARYGVLLSPDLPRSAWPARRALLAGAPDIPAVIDDDPAAAPAQVRAWIDATRGTGQVPFAIPIDEPRTPDAMARVNALSAAVRAAGGGPTSFRYAVTAPPDPAMGSAIDLYISPHAGSDVPRWSYNGKPPEAGSMVVDAAPPGPRTWGWIEWRYQLPTWYAWDALYWHDRHNRTHEPPRALDAAHDAVSFDDGDDHGNLDGVLALPGDAAHPCRPSLRLAAIRRGLEDRALLEAASACDPAATTELAKRLVPRALGDAHGEPAWPTSDAAFELARRELVTIAAGCTNRLRR